MAHDSEHEVRHGQPEADVANAGLIRPPIVYLASIGAGLLVHLFWPVQLLPDAISVPIGIILVLVASALFISAVRTLRPRQPPHDHHCSHGAIRLQPKSDLSRFHALSRRTRCMG